MHVRFLTALLLLLAAPLLMPFAQPAPPGPITAPDLAVTSVTVTRVFYPPTQFLIATRVCNFGTAAVGPAGATLDWTAQALPGLLRTGGAGNVRPAGSQPHELPLEPGACADTLSPYGHAGHLGEYEFTARITVPGDTNRANDMLKTRAAHPAILLGSGVGGTDLV